jgi:hypothetical protein
VASFTHNPRLRLSLRHPEREDIHNLNNSEMIFGVTPLAELENADENKIPHKTMEAEKAGRPST